jgi:hypothetical protein
MTVEALLNDFAIRSFRDIADGDYIAARMACRTGLVTQYLWASQQTIEKYLKCVLLLNRVPAQDVRHHLGAALSRINKSGKLTLKLTKGTEDFIDRLDTFGRFRYLEISNHAFGAELVPLDRAVWEVRRYCTTSLEPRQSVLVDGVATPLVQLAGGYLEKIISAKRTSARTALLWQNAFFGIRRRKTVRLAKWFSATNSPLYLHPELLDEVLKYVFLPKDVIAAYRAHKTP